MAEENATVNENQEIQENEVNSQSATVEQTNEYSRIEDFMQEIRARMDAIDGQIRSLKDAQAITIENGAIIRDESEVDTTDSFRPLSSLDFTIR